MFIYVYAHVPHNIETVRAPKLVVSVTSKYVFRLKFLLLVRFSRAPRRVLRQWTRPFHVYPRQWGVCVQSPWKEFGGGGLFLLLYYLS